SVEAAHLPGRGGVRQAQLLDGVWPGQVAEGALLLEVVGDVQAAELLEVVLHDLTPLVNQCVGSAAGDAAYCCSVPGRPVGGVAWRMWRIEGHFQKLSPCSCFAKRGSENDLESATTATGLRR